MLDEHGDVGQLEGAVQKGRVQGRAQRQVLFPHGGDRFGDLPGVQGDVGQVDDQQTGNDADGQNGRHPPHQVGAENGHHKDENADEEGTQQVGQACQLAEGGAAGGKGHCRGHAHDAQVQQLKQVGENRGELPVKGVVVGAVVVDLVFPGKPQAVSEEDPVVGHGQHRHDNAPGAVADKVAVDLGAGSKAAAKVGGKPHKGYPQHQSPCLSLFHVTAPPFLSKLPLPLPAFAGSHGRGSGQCPTWWGSHPRILPTAPG